MLRARRYRVFFVFTAIVVLVIFHFTRSRNWDTAVDPHEPPRPPVADSNAAPQSPQGFAPEAPPPDALEKPAIPEAKPDPQEQPPEGNNAVDDEPTPKETEKPKSPVGGAQDAQDAPSSQNKPDNHELQSGSGGEGRVEAGGQESGQKAPPHWKKLPEHFPLDPEELIKLPAGKSKSLPKLQARFKDESVSDKRTRLQRLATIKEAFEHAWTGYKSSAMGHDELEPVHGGYRDPFNGWGATLVDTLDTLWIMGLNKEFSIAVDEVKKIDFTTSAREDIPVFETAIRYLGGLLGAYDISGHKYTVLLDKAMELADILIGAFDTPNRMPMLYYKWAP
jgi:mannosyl-oligosaccharide alpha-1,2-mannosidase